MQLFRSLQFYFWCAFVHCLRKRFVESAGDFVCIVVHDKQNENTSCKVKSTLLFTRDLVFCHGVNVVSSSVI